MKNRSIVHGILKIESDEMARYDEVVAKCAEKSEIAENDCDLRIKSQKKELEKYFEDEIMKYEKKCQMDLDDLKKEIDDEIQKDKGNSSVLENMVEIIIKQVYSDD
ncbi:hypothetical protein KAJ27_18115 [bacterium]|nr:hypothetical protein [bacterium]